MRVPTVMECTAIGLSAVAERMVADETIAYLEDVMIPSTDAIVRRRGAANKYLGNTLLAFCNASLHDRTPEANVCASALAASLGPIISKTSVVIQRSVFLRQLCQLLPPVAISLLDRRVSRRADTAVTRK